MKNFIQKMLFIMSVVTIVIPTVLGAVNASEYYTRYTREFLGYLGQNNPSAVPVSKVTPNDKFYKGAAGYACASGIYINEDLLARQPFPEAVKLFVCAHESAHFALGHPYQVKRKVLEIEQEADVEAARMLCKNGYRWVVQGHVNNLRNLVNAGRGNYTDGQHPTTQQQYVYLNAVLANSPNSGKVAPKPKPVVRKPVQASPKKPVKVVPTKNSSKRNQVKPSARKNGQLNNKALQQMQLKKAASRRIQMLQGRNGIWSR